MPDAPEGQTTGGAPRKDARAPRSEWSFRYYHTIYWATTPGARREKGGYPNGYPPPRIHKIMGGSLASKSCGLGPAGFPQGLRSVAATAVSLYGPAAVSPPAGLDYHLDHTTILARPLSSSLGIFFDNTPFPSLFCRRGFSFHRPRPQLAGVRQGLPGHYAHGRIRHAHSRQATLHPAPHHVSVPHAGLHCTAAASLTLARPPRVQASTEGGSGPACRCGSPSIRQRRTRTARFAESPAPTPDWASAASTRDVIECALCGFLGPPSEKVVLTRILRHP